MFTFDSPPTTCIWSLHLFNSMLIVNQRHTALLHANRKAGGYTEKRKVPICTTNSTPTCLNFKKSNYTIRPFSKNAVDWWLDKMYCERAGDETSGTTADSRTGSLSDTVPLRSGPLFTVMWLDNPAALGPSWWIMNYKPLFDHVQLLCLFL